MHAITLRILAGADRGRVFDELMGISKLKLEREELARQDRTISVTQ